MFDFHPLVIAISLFPWLFYFSIRKKWLYYFLLLIPILLSKENLSIYIIFFWIYQFLFQKDRIIWIISVIIWIIYFKLAMDYFLPIMWWHSRYWSYDELWANPKELIINTILHPIKFLQIIFSSDTKIVTYLHHLGSWLYIWIFSPLILLLIPSYAQKFISSREEFWTLNFHYSIDIFWIIAIWIVFSFVWIRQKYPKSYKNVFIILWVFTLINSTIINLYKSPLFTLSYSLENKETLLKVMETLPDNAKISTQNNIVPHLSHNDNIYIFPNLWDSDYILLNEKITNKWPFEEEEDLGIYIGKLMNGEDFVDVKLPFIEEKLNFDSKYELIKEENWVLLFGRMK